MANGRIIDFGFEDFTLQDLQVQPGAQSRLPTQADTNRQRLIQRAEIQRRQTLLPEERAQEVQRQIQPFIQQVRQRAPQLQQQEAEEFVLENLEVPEVPEQDPFPIGGQTPDPVSIQRETQQVIQEMPQATPEDIQQEVSRRTGFRVPLSSLRAVTGVQELNFTPRGEQDQFDMGRTAETTEAFPTEDTPDTLEAIQAAGQFLKEEGTDIATQPLSETRGEFTNAVQVGVLTSAGALEETASRILSRANQLGKRAQRDFGEFVEDLSQATGVGDISQEDVQATVFNQIPNIINTATNRLEKQAQEDRELSQFLAQSQDDPNKIITAVGQGVPTLLTALGAGAVGTAVGGPGVGTAAAVGTGGALAGGFARQEAEQFLRNSDDPELRRLADDEAFLDRIMATTGAAEGVLEAIPIVNFLNDLPGGRQARRALTRNVAQEVISRGADIAKRGGTQALSEAGTEFLQETVSNAVARTYNENQELFEGAPLAALAGGILGGGLSLTTQAGAGAARGGQEVVRRSQELARQTGGERGFIRIQPEIQDEGQRITQIFENKKTDSPRLTVNQIKQVQNAQFEPLTDTGQPAGDRTPIPLDPVEQVDSQLETFVQNIRDIKEGRVSDNLADHKIVGQVTEGVNISELKNVPVLLNRQTAQKNIREHGGIPAENTAIIINKPDEIVLTKDRTGRQKLNFIKTDSEGRNLLVGANRVDGFAVVTAHEVRQNLESIRNRGDVIFSGETADLPSISSVEDGRSGAVIELSAVTEGTTPSVGEAAPIVNRGVDNPDQALDEIQQATQSGTRPVSEQQPASEQPVRPRGEASERLNLPTSKQPLDEKTIIQRRRAFVRDLRERFGLTDSELRKVGNNRDIRLMSNYEFKQFIDRMEQRAVEVADTRQAKAELIDVIEQKNLQKIENYRRAQDIPPVSQMSAEQIRQYTDALEQFQVNDEFLTQRTLETIDRTNLAGVRTMREVKERLVKEVEKTTGQKLTIKELEEATDFGAIQEFLNRFRYDTALAESNPFFDLVVKRVQTKQIEGQASFLRVQDKINALAKKAKRSRSRGVVGDIRQAFIPQYPEIIRYLEAPADQKTFYANQLTTEELEYANYVSQYYSDAYEHLVSMKEIYGSRFVDQYFTHTRKTFLEKWSDDGLLQAVKNFWQSHKEDQIVANIIDQDTGNILPKSKFFQYTLQRTGTLEPSQNLTRVFLQYARMFERKKMFDQIIPEIETYTESLTPRNLTPQGLEMNRELKSFVKRYLNNKKGRRENFGGVVKQNGPVDMGLRLGNTFLSVMDLGGNVFASAATTIGEMMMTYQSLGKIGMARALKRRIWDAGLRRSKTESGKQILKEAEPFIGRNVWTEIFEADQQFGDRAMMGIFGIFSQSSVEANKLFLLGTVTRQELRSGKLSAERLAQLRLEAGRWRDMGREVKSIVGSTSVGQAWTKYKGWAIPILRTNATNLTGLARRLRNKGFGDALTSREAAEIYRAIEMSTILVMLGGYLISEDDDDTFVGKMKARAYQEAMTLLGGIDISMYTSVPRVVQFADQLANNLVQIGKLEEYQQDSQWGNEGDLKGLRGLQRQFTPRIISQFQGGEQSTPQAIDLGGESGQMIDFGFDEMLGNQQQERAIDFGFEEMFQ